MEEHFNFAFLIFILIVLVLLISIGYKTNKDINEHKKYIKSKYENELAVIDIAISEHISQINKINERINYTNAHIHELDLTNPTTRYNFNQFVRTAREEFDDHYFKIDLLRKRKTYLITALNGENV